MCGGIGLQDGNYVQLRFDGGIAAEGELNIYDGALSYEGIGRFLLIAAHYYATGKINTKAPFSKADVRIKSPERGSFVLAVTVGVASAVIAAPFVAYITYLMNKSLPSHDPQMQSIYNELKEANRLKRKEMGLEPKSWAETVDYDEELKKHRAELQALRSILTPSLEKSFRPIGRSAEYGVVSVGRDAQPVRVLNTEMVRQIDADILDDEPVITTGVVNDFSQSTQRGFFWDDREDRRIRFHYDAGKLPKRNDLSWSLYEQEPLALTGKYVRYLDGSVKKLLIRSTEKIAQNERSEINPMSPNAETLRKLGEW